MESERASEEGGRREEESLRPYACIRRGANACMRTCVCTHAYICLRVRMHACTCHLKNVGHQLKADRSRRPPPPTTSSPQTHTHTHIHTYTSNPSSAYNMSLSLSLCVYLCVCVCACISTSPLRLWSSTCTRRVSQVLPSILPCSSQFLNGLSLACPPCLRTQTRECGRGERGDRG